VSIESIWQLVFTDLAEDATGAVLSLKLSVFNYCCKCGRYKMSEQWMTPNVGEASVRKKGKGHVEEKSPVEWNYVLRYPDIYKKVCVDWSSFGDAETGSLNFVSELTGADIELWMNLRRTSDVVSLCWLSCVSKCVSYVKLNSPYQIYFYCWNMILTWPFALRVQRIFTLIAFLHIFVN